MQLLARAILQLLAKFKVCKILNAHAFSPSPFMKVVVIQMMKIKEKDSVNTLCVTGSPLHNQCHHFQTYIPQ